MENPSNHSPQTAGQRRSTAVTVLSWLISVGLGVLLGAIIKVGVDFLQLS